MGKRLEREIGKIVCDRELLHDFAAGVQKLGEELGVSPEENSREEFIGMVDLEGEYDEEVKRRGRVFPRTTDWKGRCIVIGLDNFDGDSWFDGKFATAEEALIVAERETEREEAKDKRIRGDFDYLTRRNSAITTHTAYYPDGQKIFRDREGNIVKSLPKPRKEKTR